MCIRDRVNAIHAAEMHHSERIWNHLQSIDSVTTLGNLADGPHVATLSFTVAGMPAQQFAEMLDADYHICCRAGLHCAPQAHKAYATDTGGGLDCHLAILPSLRMLTIC